MTNERTSKKVAAIAGRVLKAFEDLDDDYTLRVDLLIRPITIGDLKALAASCLTQSPNKPKKQAKVKSK